MGNDIVFIFGFIFGCCFIGMVWAIVRFVIQGEYKIDERNLSEVNSNGEGGLTIE